MSGSNAGHREKCKCFETSESANFHRASNGARQGQVTVRMNRASADGYLSFFPGMKNESTKLLDLYSKPVQKLLTVERFIRSSCSRPDRTYCIRLSK